MEGEKNTTLRDIFALGFDAYARERRLPYRSHEAANAIMQCRTAALGGHVQQCINGHINGVQYNSCRHRSCPRCNERAKTQWADAQAARLLCCDHYHVIFTIPHELLDLWSHNRALLPDVLFAGASETLLTLLGDEKHLGARPGIVASLHTWGRRLSRHPHLHCLVTGGGMDAAGVWRNAHRGYLLPVKVVKAMYRGKLLAGLWAALQERTLTLPAHLSPEDAEVLLRRLGRKDFNIRIQQRYSHGRGVMVYLGRYVKGGPISDHRLLEASADSVHFRYEDHRDGKQKILALRTSEFIERVLWHVPEKGRHTTRHYGLYNHKARAQRARCREQLGQAPEAPYPEPVDWQTYLERRGHAEKARCRECGARIQAVARIPRAGRKDPISIGPAVRSNFVQQLDQAAESAAPNAPPDRPHEQFFLAS